MQNIWKFGTDSERWPNFPDCVVRMAITSIIVISLTGWFANQELLNIIVIKRTYFPAVSSAWPTIFYESSMGLNVAIKNISGFWNWRPKKMRQWVMISC